MNVLVRLVGLLVRAWILLLGKLPPRVALRELFRLQDHISLRIDQAAIALDGGVHPKHRLMRYHDFFVERIGRDDRVLDVGCGYGAVASDVAERTGAHVTGVDVDLSALAQARARHLPNERLDFVEADIRTYEPETPFDVVILSNVLEHIADRPALLRRLLEVARPSRLLIRVPLFDRDWRVPMREEVGLTPFQDATHEVEYRAGELEAELASVGLQVDEAVRIWGELWVSVRPAAR